ncbi:MAG: YcaO-like family protein [Verrucomicrobia bacterium]|nr:YcaO-like family protein [Verrucomicrobiota bacterium]MCH8510947.1 YcaO-like family protein [Kiritimatiellia bacterium]
MADLLNQCDLDRMIGSSGAIKDLIKFPRSPLDLPLHVVTARVQDEFEGQLSESVARCVASGVSDDPQIAYAAAIGEAWERIAFVQHHERLKHAPAKPPSPQGLPADSFFELPFLLDAGVNRHKWAEQASTGPCKTVTYHEILRGKKVKPCELPAWVAVPGAESTLFETTNGLACGHKFDVALDRAVREVVERDSLMLVWLTRCGGTRVSPSRLLTPGQVTQITRLTDMGIQFRLRDISSVRGIHVMLAVVFARFPNNRVGIAFGAGAHRLQHLAARHAFREAGLSWRGVAWRTLNRERPEPTTTVPNSFAQHAEYYSSWDRMHLLDFLLDDDPIIEEEEPLRAPKAALNPDAGHINMLLSQGKRIFALDITPQQAAETGLVVVQAVIPGLVPLYISDRCADQLALERLPTTIGGRLQDRPESLNTRIHPWP